MNILTKYGFCIKYCKNIIQHMESKLLSVANFIVISFYLDKRIFDPDVFDIKENSF